MTSPASRKKPLLAALGTVLLWAFAFPASKAALPYFSAEEMVLLRYLVACGFYLAWFAAGGFVWPQLRDWPAIFLLGILGVTVYQLLFVLGLGRVAAGAAAMIIAANPVFAGLLARVFLREKLSRLAWCGIGISIAGVALIAVEKDLAGEFIGALLLIAATLSISVYFVFQKPFFRRYSPLSMTAWTSFAGTVPLLYYLPEAVDAARAAPAGALWSVAAMGVFSSGIGFVLWLYALSKLPAGTVTSFFVFAAGVRHRHGVAVAARNPHRAGFHRRRRHLVRRGVDSAAEPGALSRIAAIAFGPICAAPRSAANATCFSRSTKPSRRAADTAP